ncbi:MAG: hypothetical protein U0T75_03850 [Chitinophagales bacterium]
MGLFSPPATGNGWVGDFANACGSDDIGAEVLATWTPPIPDPRCFCNQIFCTNPALLHFPQVVPYLVAITTGIITAMAYW